MNRNRWLIPVTVICVTVGVVYHLWANWGLVTIHAQKEPLSKIIRAMDLMNTNFSTIKRQIKRLKDLEAGTEAGGDFENYTKKEQLMLARQRDKLSKNLSGIKAMGRLPGLIFVVDAKKEKIAVKQGV